MSAPNFNELYSPWLKFDMDIWQNMICDLRPKMVKGNSLVFQQQYPLKYLYLVNTGRVRITLFDSSGEEQAFFISERGTPIGEEAILLNSVASFTAVCIVDTTLYYIPRHIFLKNLETDRALSLHITKLQAYKNMVLIKAFWMLSFCSAYQRVIIILYSLMQHYGIKESGGVRIGVKFTHSDLAGIINTSRVTVNHEFIHLAAQNIITKQHGYYIICDPEKLKVLADKKKF